MGLVGTKAEINAVGSAGVDYRATLAAEPQNFPLPLADGLRVLKNFLSQAGSNLAAQAFAFFSTAYIARRLQAQGFGWIGFAQGLLTYFTLNRSRFAHDRTARGREAFPRGPEMG